MAHGVSDIHRFVLFWAYHGPGASGNTGAETVICPAGYTENHQGKTDFPTRVARSTRPINAHPT